MVFSGLFNFFCMDLLGISYFVSFSCSFVEVPGRAVSQFALEYMFMNLPAA